MKYGPIAIAGKLKACPLGKKPKNFQEEISLGTDNKNS